MPKRTFPRRNKIASLPTTARIPLLRDLMTFADNDPRSYGQICEDAGYHIKTLSVIKHNQYTPKIDKVINMGEALGYELVWRKKQ